MTKMPTVAEVIAFLQTMPQHAKVHCMVEKQQAWESWAEYAPIDLEECHAMDFTDTVKYPEMGGHIIIELRGQE